MTPEQRWRSAFEAEESDPSEWHPDLEQMQQRVIERLAAAGCTWPELAVRVLSARSRSDVDRAAFAARLGLTEHALEALEGASSIR